MIQITLAINGRSRTYTATEVCMRTSLEAYQLYRDYTGAAGDYPQELLDKCGRFVCGCFGDAFTIDQLLDGYQGSAFSLYPGMLAAVVGYVQDKIENFPEPAKGMMRSLTPEMTGD